MMMMSVLILLNNDHLQQSNGQVSGERAAGLLKSVSYHEYTAMSTVLNTTLSLA